MEVLVGIATGLSNKEVDEQMFVVKSTSKTHINNIYTKLDVKTRTQAMARAKGWGVLKF